MAEKSEEREAYLSHFAFGADMQRHYAANHRSVRGFAGTCSCRWLVLDIDRADPGQAVDSLRMASPDSVAARHANRPGGEKRGSSAAPP